jgi:hypothetical protein
MKNPMVASGLTLIFCFIAGCSLFEPQGPNEGASQVAYRPAPPTQEPPEAVMRQQRIDEGLTRLAAYRVGKTTYQNFVDDAWPDVSSSTAPGTVRIELHEIKEVTRFGWDNLTPMGEPFIVHELRMGFDSNVVCKLFFRDNVLISLSWEEGYRPFRRL